MRFLIDIGNSQNFSFKKRLRNFDTLNFVKIWPGSGSGSVIIGNGSADPDPGPYQNETKIKWRKYVNLILEIGTYVQRRRKGGAGAPPPGILKWSVFWEFWGAKAPQIGAPCPPGNFIFCAPAYFFKHGCSGRGGGGVVEQGKQIGLKNNNIKKCAG